MSQPDDRHTFLVHQTPVDHRPIGRREIDRLVVEHLPDAIRFAQHLTSDADVAEDVVQEALCRVLRRGDSFRGEAAFRTWLLQIVVNVDRDRRRRVKKNDPLPSEELVAHTPEPQQQAAAEELGDKIRKTIDALPERQREVALLSFGEDCSASEIAEILETTVANVHTCLHLARQRIAVAIDVASLKKK